MGFFIRKALLSDAPALADLLRQIGWWSAFEEETPATNAAHVAQILALDLTGDCHSVYIAEDEVNHTLLGYIAAHWLPYLFLHGPEGFISELFVRPEARSQGVGAALLAAAQAEASRRGCVRLSLLNGKHRESYQRSFYPKHGWEERPFMANFVFWIPDEKH